MTLRASGASNPAIVGATELDRFGHFIVTVNDALSSDVLWPRQGVPSNAGYTTQGLAAAWAKTDSRGVRQLKPTLAQGTMITPGPGQKVLANFRDTFAGSGSGALEALASPVTRAMVWQAWLRKATAGDPCTARQFFGFMNTSNSPLGATKVCSRVGLIGDGVNGFRFGSVNCPDGAAGVNGFADIDANAVQPAVLANPVLKWFHVKIKMVPPTPLLPGAVGCYLDGQLVAKFSALANFPRGTNAANRDFYPIEACCFADFDAVTQLNGFMLHEGEYYFTSDLTL